MNNRRVYHARGKILGGSSSINGMIFIRGNPLDYEKWAKDPGMETWDYAHCLPYFKKSETRTAGAERPCVVVASLHLETGPATNPLFNAFLIRPNKRAIHSQTMSMDFSRKVLACLIAILKTGGAGLLRMRTCIRFWENEKTWK